MGRTLKNLSAGTGEFRGLLGPQKSYLKRSESAVAGLVRGNAYSSRVGFSQIRNRVKVRKVVSRGYKGELIDV